MRHHTGRPGAPYTADRHEQGEVGPENDTSDLRADSEPSSEDEGPHRGGDRILTIEAKPED